VTIEKNMENSEYNKRRIPWWGWVLGIISINIFVNILVHLINKSQENSRDFQVRSDNNSEVLPQKHADLKLIKGIGPKISEVLQSAGIQTFAQLAEIKHEEITEILSKGGIRLADTTSWADQARKLC